MDDTETGLKKISRRDYDGYMTVEAAFILPLIAMLLLGLIILGSFLHQSVFLQQEAYLAALRAGNAREGAFTSGAEREHLAEIACDQLEDFAVLAFGPTQRSIRADLVSLQVSLSRQTPLHLPGKDAYVLQKSGRCLYRDPVAYIRGIRFLTEEVKGQE